MLCMYKSEIRCKAISLKVQKCRYVAHTLKTNAFTMILDTPHNQSPQPFTSVRAESRRK